MTVDEMQTKLSSWHKRARGSVIDPMRTMVKVTEEVGELAKEVLRGNTDNGIQELADCLITLFHMARFYNVDVLDIMYKKYLVLEERLKEKKK